MTNTEGVFFVIGYAGLLAAIIAFMVYTVPALREEHRLRQASRLEWPGWTLPWWMNWMWWVGLENLSPRSLRRQPDPDAVFGRAVRDMYRKMNP